MKTLFCDRLRALRGATSSAKTAAMFGIAQSTWSSWENGAREPNIGMIVRICTHFGVSSDYLLGLSGIANALPAPQLKVAEPPEDYDLMA